MRHARPRRASWPPDARTPGTRLAFLGAMAHRSAAARAVVAAAGRALPWLRRVFLLLAGLQLFYLIGVNGLFWSGAYERLINGAQDEVRLEIGHAWTVLPFVVHVRDVRVVVDEPVVQMDIRADEATVRFHVTKLFNRLVHMSDVRGEGFVFRLRRRVPVADLSDERFASLPPIPALPRPILWPDPDPDTDLSNNWNVRMDDVDASFDEIWIDGERFLGAAHLRGSYTIMTEQWLELPEASMRFDHGVLLSAHRPAIVALSGEVSGSLPRIDFREDGAPEVLEGLRAEARLELVLFDASAVARHLPVEDRVRGGMGALRLEGALAGGVIQPESHLEVRLDDLALRAGPVHLRTPLRLEATSDGERIEGRLALGGTVGFDAEIPTLTITQAELTGSARAADLREGIADPKGKLDVQGGTPRLRIDGPPTITRGEASLSAQLELDGGVIAGAVGAAVRSGALRWDDLAFAGEAETTIYVRGAIDPLRLDNAKGELSVDGVVGDDEECWHARAALTEAEGSRASGRVGVALQMESLEPFLAISHFDDEVPDVAEALLDLDEVIAHFGTRWDEEATTLTLHRLECDDCAAAGRFRLTDRVLRGAAIVQAGPITVGIVKATETPETTLFPGDDWRERHLPGLR